MSGTYDIFRFLIFSILIRFFWLFLYQREDNSVIIHISMSTIWLPKYRYIYMQNKSIFYFHNRANEKFNQLQIKTEGRFSKSLWRFYFLNVFVLPVLPFCMYMKFIGLQIIGLNMRFCKTMFQRNATILLITE